MPKQLTECSVEIDLTRWPWCKARITMSKTIAEPTLSTQFSQQGFAIIDQCLSSDTVNWLIRLIEEARNNTESAEAVANTSGVYALRNLTDAVPEITHLISSPEVAGIVSAILGPDAFMVRSTLFDKTDGANWGVFWHQDLSIAVKERHEVAGFHAWTRKAGVSCVQPPAEIMSRILAVRLHLDNCTAENGALKVLPGSHANHGLSSDTIERMGTEISEVICEVPAGGAVLMRPLTLHASSPMKKPGHRRVIHFEFAAHHLPAPLEWRYQIPCRC